MYHSGLFFATLVVQLTLANGLPASNVYPRKECSACGEDHDDEEKGDNDIVVNSRQYYRRKGKGGCDEAEPGCSTSLAATTGSGVSTTSPTNASANTSTTASSTSTSMTTTSMTATSSTTSTPPTSAPLIAATNRSTITTGGIIGAAFGSVVIAGLALIVCGTYLHRWRKARKRGKGFVPATYLGSSPPSNPQFPTTEMSQTQSNPIIASAVASRMTSSPPRHYPHSSTTVSLSPLIPATSLEHSRSFTNSSNRRTSLSYTDGSSSHEPVHSLHEMSSSSWGASLNMNVALGHSTAGSTTVSSVVSEPSALLRVLTGHQKALEADDQKQSQGGPSNSKEDEAGIPEVHDPPPRYDA